VDAARWQLAAELPDDLRGRDARIRETRKKTTAAVAASGTGLTGLFGVGPVIAAAVIGDVRQVARFPRRGHFAACNDTAPIAVSSGGRKICRLSRRGNRRLNHAIPLAAATQIRYRHTKGHAYYDKKLAEGKTRKQALRALKRQINNAIFGCLQQDPRRAAATPAKNPGGQPGNHATSRAAGSHPGPPALRASHSRACHPPYDPGHRPHPCVLSRAAATPREQAAGSRTGHRPAAQRRPRRP
jgi:hypothetical protein